MKKELTKEQIIQGRYYYPKGFIRLIPTNHCIERLTERGYGLDFLPSMVKITENNIYNGKTSNDKSLCSVVLKIEYSCERYIFLCINPFDGAIKSIWYSKKSFKNNFAT